MNVDERMVRAFKALGSPKRLAIIGAIRDLRSRGERPGFDAVMRALKLVPGELGYHLKVLREAGLIENGVDGYRLTEFAETLTGVLVNHFVIISKRMLQEKLKHAEEIYKTTRDERVKAVIDTLRWLMSIAEEHEG